MFVLVQFALACLLIAAGSTLVLLWLSAIALSYGGQSGLLPWTAAAAVIFGLAFVAISAIAGVPGILWANHLARGVPLKWRTIAKLPGRIGTSILIAGFAVAFGVLIGEQFRTKNPYDGCISYRDAAASAALAASGATQGIDCPTKN